MTFAWFLLLAAFILFLAGTVFLAVALLDFLGYVMTAVPFVPTPHAVVAAVVKLSPRDTGVFYDLGSGEGRVVSAVAYAYPNMRAIGVEKAPFPILLTIFRRTMQKKQPANAEFLFRDIKAVSVTNASYVFMYLFPNVVGALERKLENELPKGARVVSCDFPLKKRAAQSTLEVQNGKRVHTLYVYDF